MIVDSQSIHHHHNINQPAPATKNNNKKVSATNNQTRSAQPGPITQTSISNALSILDELKINADQILSHHKLIATPSSNVRNTTNNNNSTNHPPDNNQHAD